MEIKLKEILENSSDATITIWHAKENDRVNKGDDLLEIVTDKATFDVAAPCSGVLTRIEKKEGEKILADEVIAEIQEEKN